MEPTVHYSEYILGGLRQRTIRVDGTGLRGTATEQRTGGWAWFLRHPDGGLAAEGVAPAWECAVDDIAGLAATGATVERGHHPGLGS